MPEIYDSNPRTKSKYDGEAVRNKKYAKLGARITDNVPHKLFGLKTTDEEYWGLREVLTEPEVDIALTMKQRKWYTYDQLLEMNRKNMDAETFKKTLDLLCVHGFVEYDYGDHYDDNGPIPGAPKELRYRTSYFVPGSAELFNSSVDRIEKNPPVAKMFERMTFLPLEHITSMVRPGGNGIGMHVIPVEKEVAAERTAVDIEKISYWLQKYDGHLSAGICSCRASRAMLGEGCTDDVNDWCIQVGDMADYTVETGRAHYITKEEALDILRKAEENGYVHQVTNIDGADHIFDICNCNVQICNALRTSLLYNTPNMSKSAYTARVDKEKCVACGRCVEFCPAGALKLGQKLCQKDGKPVEYPKSVLPDRIRWGKYAWDENYRDTARVNTHKTGSAPCKAACPAHVSIQGYLKMAREGRYDEALALIKRENPFPAICGRVCNKRCEDACTRGTIDAPVAIDDVKKYLAERDLHAETRYVPKKTINRVSGEWPQKIAIIGGGPAGLSCAYYLAERGYKPTVFEQNSKPGGMLTYGIPAFKLEKKVVQAEIDIIREMGVDIRCGVEVGKDVTIPELRRQGYRAFYIAIGCQGGRLAGVPGEDAEGVYTAVEFLKKTAIDERWPIDGDAVVIGGGNVAIDVSRTAVRCGATKVSQFCLEGEREMPASDEEVAEARADGVEIGCGWGPKEILTENGRVKGIVLKRCVSVFDAQHRFSPRYDEADTITVPCSAVFMAVGQSIQWGNLIKDTNVKTGRGNGALVDSLTCQTDEPDVFAGGDVVTGPKFAIDAIAAGKEAAISIHRFVQPHTSLTIGRNRNDFIELNKDDVRVDDYDHSKPRRPAAWSAARPWWTRTSASAAAFAPPSANSTPSISSASGPSAPPCAAARTS